MTNPGITRLALTLSLPNVFLPPNQPRTQEAHTIIIIHIRSGRRERRQRRNHCINGPTCTCQRSSAVPVVHVFFLVCAFGDVDGGDLGGGILGFEGTEGGGYGGGHGFV